MTLAAEPVTWSECVSISRANSRAVTLRCCTSSACSRSMESLIAGRWRRRRPRSRTMTHPLVLRRRKFRMCYVQKMTVQCFRVENFAEAERCNIHPSPPYFTLSCRDSISLDPKVNTEPANLSIPCANIWPLQGKFTPSNSTEDFNSSSGVQLKMGTQDMDYSKLTF